MISKTIKGCELWKNVKTEADNSTCMTLFLKRKEQITVGMSWNMNVSNNGIKTQIIRNPANQLIPLKISDALLSFISPNRFRASKFSNTKIA